ncbi:ankyrin repeat-containing domain protein [Mycena latifolia]|nr:ankyrin repeat-containing domain protein [Mycena latifolia]
MADIVGLIASVLQLVDTAVKSLRYIKDFRDAPKDQQRLLLEIQTLEPLIRELDKRTKNNQNTGLNSGMQEIAQPLTQLKGIMEPLTKKLDSNRISKFSSRLNWPLWGKEEVQAGLDTIERFKSLLNAWLGMDIWSAFRPRHVLGMHDRDCINDGLTDVALSIKEASEEQRVDHGYIMESVKHFAEENRVAHNREFSHLFQVHKRYPISKTPLRSKELIITLDIAKSIRDVARNQERYHESAERDEIIKWYAPLNFFLRQADIFSTRQPGTGEWLLNDHKFRAWRSSRGKILWCRGIRFTIQPHLRQEQGPSKNSNSPRASFVWPELYQSAYGNVLATIVANRRQTGYESTDRPGAGKTVLVSIVVELLRADLERQNPGVAVLYLNHKETDAQSPSNLLAGLWRQLIFEKPMSTTLHRLHAKHREQRTRPSLEDTYSMLCSIVSEHSGVFIVVDALDEYPEELRDILLRHLLALGPTVNLMLTSRPHIKIDHVATNADIETLEIRATAHDIRRYMAAQISKSSRLSRHIKNCPDLQEKMESIIVRRSDGMFLLAKFHIDSLTMKHTIKAVLDTLVNMPNDLNRSYDDIMQRINRQSEDDRILARRTLSWISNVKRPLRPSELREALAVESEATKLDPYNLLDIDTILAVCAGLVIVDEADDLVRLIHYTTQDYLDRIQADTFPEAQTEIASVCITYLTFEVFSRKTHDYNNHLVPHSLLDYAVDYGLIHARGKPESGIRHLILSFLKECSAWRKLWNWRHGLEKIPPSATTLFIAAIFRLEHICRYLIKEEGTGGLLQDASLEGLTDVVRILVENGANVDVNEGEYDSPLLAASVRGHDDIIRLLLAHGADINLHGRRYGTALQMAAFFNNKKSARLLIDVGAYINAEAGRYGTALYAAATQGNKEMVHLLLEHGAAVHQEGGHYGTALLRCAIARVLIEHGANIDEETTIHRATRMLHRAISMGHEDIIRLLLEHGTPVDCKGASGYSLDVALQCRRYEIADLLIARGTVGTQFNTLLHLAAVSEGHDDVVRILVGAFTLNEREEKFMHYTEMAKVCYDITDFLIQHRTNATKIIARGGHLSAVLFTAVLEGHLDGIPRLLLQHGDGALSFTLNQSDFATARFLIEHGGNVNEPGCKGNPLSIASSQGHNGIVRLLIEHAADVNAQCEQYGSALQAASSEGHTEIVSLLLERGADVNAQGPYGNALQAASWAGHKDIVGLLTKHSKADINAQGPYGTALQAASWAGHVAIVGQLLEHGADVGGEGPNGSALRAASFRGSEEVVRLLIEHGTDINAHSQHGSALQTASFARRQDNVRMLIAHGADVNAPGPYGSALRAASWAGYEEIVRILIKHGADVNAQGPDGSALQAASSGGYRDIVSLLIEHGADVTAKGSVLQEACSEGHEEIVRLLIEHGADVNATGGRYESALRAARARRHEGVARLLVQYGAV